MQNNFSRLLIALAVAAPSAAMAKEPVTASRQANEAATARHYATLIKGDDPKLAELTMFFTQMPKGGDLHHHYSGAIYVEQYLDFLDRQGLCVNKQSYRIETDKNVIAAERAKPAKERNCLSSVEVYADDFTWRELVQRWSNKDFDNHGALQPAPDRLFFQTFGYFGPVSNANFKEGLQELKKRAIAENVSYIETMFKMAPATANAEFDARAWQLAGDDAALDIELQKALEAFERDPAFAKSVADFVAKIDEASSGIDDERFTMRYQTYVLRLLNPSQVFSSMVAAFKSASHGRQGGGRQHRGPGKHHGLDARLRAAHEDVRLPEQGLPERQGGDARGRTGDGRRAAGRPEIPHRPGPHGRRRRPHRPWHRPGARGECTGHPAQDARWTTSRSRST